MFNKEREKQMNVYIDCGTHLGEGIKLHMKPWQIDDSWRIIGFEANPYTFEILQSLIKQEKKIPGYEWMSFTNLEVRHAAVWTKNGQIEFGCSKYAIEEKTDFIENLLELNRKSLEKGLVAVDIINSTQPLDGSSSIFHRKMRKFLSRHGDDLQKTIVYDELVRVPSIDFSEFLLKEVNVGDVVYCKMDIERAEFAVLLKGIKTNAISRMNFLDIEWHHYNNIILRVKRIYIEYRLKKLGIVVNDWK
jgi:FkbM family methyltransferase